ncbi:MAG TPA: LysR family transcriptional regulator [Kofleriaceae bacterium]|nr:LysR family transcriptional regulator [Kofleriaceae bacterium]
MKVSPVDLNLLAVLEAIVETRSVGGAAERVGITKAAMSHALARLRAQIGDPVLVRAGSGWQLSERAQAIATQVRDVVDGARALLDRERTFEAATTTREFRIHATDHVLALLGTTIGALTSKQAPAATLRFVAIEADDVLPLRSGRNDLAIGVFPDLPAEFRTQALFQERFACVVRDGHPRIKTTLTLDAYLGLQHVVVAPRGRRGSIVDDVLAERGHARTVTRYVPYFVVALDHVSRTDHVVTISERLGRAYADRFGLRVLRPPLALPPYTIAQVWHPRVDADPAHRWLRKLVASAAATLKQ